MKRLWLSTLVLMAAVQADECVEKVETDTTIPQYDNRINFSLSRLGYERLKSNDVYVGLQEWFTLLNAWNRRAHWTNELEARVGYNLCFEEKDRLTPMIGGGFFKYYSKNNSQGIGYGLVAVFYEHTVNRLFSMGLNLKGTVGASKHEKSESLGNPILGYQVDIPFTFRFGKKRNWDYRIAPFYLSMNGKNRKISTYGFYGEFGYRF